MITKADAEAIVMAELKKMETPSMPFAINESATLEKPFGWVFFYNTYRFLETGEYVHQLAGNGPVIVNRNSGEITRGRSNQALDAFIKEYERALES